jgi:transcriptional regulator with XRE-family HTH domain
MNLPERLAANLRARRARLHLSQADVASAAGISVSYVSMLERGQRSPQLETVEVLADALQVDPVALLK